MSNHLNEIKRQGFARFATRPSEKYRNPGGHERFGPVPMPMTTQVPLPFETATKARPHRPQSTVARPPNSNTVVAPSLDMTMNIRGGSGPPSPPPQSRPARASRNRTLAWLAGSKPVKHSATRYRRSEALALTEGDREYTIKNANALLLRGYGVAEENGEVTFQPRRTLDQYFYSHLDNTAHRDKDQVVYRYTKTEDPKIFMVDQMWLWIINGGLCNPTASHYSR